MYTLRSRLSPETPLIGTFCGISSPAMVEILGGCGLDFVLVDAEHCQIGREKVEDLVRAGDAAGVPVVVRVPTHEGDWIGSALDGGASGVLVPRIGTADQARAAVAAARYTPDGKRGCGPARANGYGQRLMEYIQTANASLLVALQIETVEGVENIEEILAVPDIDVIFIGPGDLALSLGDMSPAGKPRLDAAIAAVVDACKARGVQIGIFHLNMADIAPSIERGISFFAAAGDSVFLQRGIAAAKAEMGTARPQADAAR